MDFLWRTHGDQCGSDHTPIFIDINKPISEEKIPQWQINKVINMNTPIKKVLDMARKMNEEITTSKQHLKKPNGGKMYRKGGYCQLVGVRI